MTDEVSLSFRVSILVCFTAGLISAVVAVSTMSLGILNSYNQKYDTAVAQATTSGISDLAVNKQVACPIIYATLAKSIDSIEAVYVGRYNSSTGNIDSASLIYQFDNPNTATAIDNRKYKDKTLYGVVRLYPSTVNSSMYIIYIGEVR